MYFGELVKILKYHGQPDNTGESDANLKQNYSEENQYLFLTCTDKMIKDNISVKTYNNMVYCKKHYHQTTGLGFDVGNIVKGNKKLETFIMIQFPGALFILSMLSYHCRYAS